MQRKPELVRVQEVVRVGDPRKTRKHYKRPLKIWDKINIEREKQLVQTYGLKNKRELWRAETLLRKKRQSARKLLALVLEERLKREKELLQSLARMGVLSEKTTLDDVLTLSIENFLERRLQTIVWRKGFANTPKQARQFITHGHVAIAGKKVTAPSYLVTAADEPKIGYYAGKAMVLRPVQPAKKEKEKPAREAAGKAEAHKGKEIPGKAAEERKAGAKEQEEPKEKGAEKKGKEPVRKEAAGQEKKGKEASSEKKPEEKKGAEKGKEEGKQKPSGKPEGKEAGK